MEIKYHLTEEDYLHFNLFHIKNSKTTSRALSMQRFLTPIFFLILSYILSVFLDEPFLGLFIIFFILSILWIIFYPKYFYSLIIRQVKKMIKEGRNDGLLGDHHMIMTEEEIVDSTANSETKVTWSGIEMFKEDDDYFYLYNSSVSAYILPKRALKDVEEIKNYIQSKKEDVPKR
ncbi:YcxB family protein [Metabacillus fastidiosus]|uniref:YcxB family protein n=3 Tax=Metabacillus fastidiosus TaxID=1458 RepID=A0ABU6NX20_9BACI|nr:YcxB family protein [Metabacillus fastidiosus]MED4401268.1 YcxB family protein [Metabacillus fastidiosus]MED4464195.1 YcxB family protein [Metabacillus fastidiosus]